MKIYYALYIFISIQLSAQLLERENTQLAKDREAVNDLTEQLKDLIKVSQTTVATK